MHHDYKDAYSQKTHIYCILDGSLFATWAYFIHTDVYAVWLPKS